MRGKKILGALIGLAGACGNNPKTDDTDRLMIRALAFPFPDEAWKETREDEMVWKIHEEKYRIAPGCANCASPCGNTSDWDVDRLEEAEEEIREIKRGLIADVRALAVRTLRAQEAKESLTVDPEIFYRAVLFVSYEIGKDRLLALREEIRAAGVVE